MSEQTSSTEILDLPEEILEQMLLFLPFKDLLIARSVCETFLVVINRTASKKLVFKCDDYQNLDDYISESLPPIYHMKINISSEIGGPTKVSKFWTKYGRDVSTVSIKFTNYFYNQLLLDIYTYCPNLKSLTCDVLDRICTIENIPITPLIERQVVMEDFHNNLKAVAIDQERAVRAGLELKAVIDRVCNAPIDWEKERMLLFKRKR